LPEGQFQASAMGHVAEKTTAMILQGNELPNWMEVRCTIEDLKMFYTDYE